MLKDKYKNLQKNKVPLTDKERAEVIKRKAVWGNNDLAVWKSVDKAGKATYVTSTHRAYNTAPTLNGAIGRFHSFIKSTAREESFDMEKIAIYEDMIYKEAEAEWVLTPEQERAIMANDRYVQRYWKAKKSLDRVKKSDTISSTMGGAAAGTIFGAGLAKSKQYPHKVRAALGGAALTGAALGGITNKFHDKINRASYDSLEKDKRLATYSLGVNLARLNQAQLERRNGVVEKQASLYEDMIYKEANAFLKSKQAVKNALKKVLNKEEDSIFSPRYADDVINLASKIKPIDCEVCGYKGIPTYNGYCPRCGSLGGIKPTEHEENKRTLEVPTYSNIAEESRLSFEE